jgi:hypothetical protein
MSRISRAPVLVTAVIAFSLSAHAVTYSDATLKGSYSFLINLHTADQSTNQFAMVGVLSFDGAGNVTGSYTSISEDTASSGSLGGTYSVSANGTGTITFSSGSTAEFAVTLNAISGGVAKGVQLLQINDSNNEVMSGTAVLQSTTSHTYSAASLKGTFALLYQPWTADASLSEDGGVALFTFDGKGNVTTTETIMYDGTKFSGSGSFTYTVSANGTGTISPKTNGPEFAFALNTASSSGKAAGYQFLDTNTSDGPGNMVITGSAVEQ